MVKEKIKATKKAVAKKPVKKTKTKAPIWWFEEVGINVQKNAEQISSNIMKNAEQISKNIIKNTAKISANIKALSER
jgi:hypothetical protein